MASYGSLPFAEQVAFFRQKLNIPTRRWDDLLGAAHDRAFVVAGAISADLLADLNTAVARAIEQGVSIEQFRADFESIVAKHGWTGWTGEGTDAGRAWRARVIYETNLRTSHAAGRYAQLQALKAKRPYWRYRHSDGVRYPRPHHASLDGLILRADDPFWKTAYPPNGFGCRCFVESLSETQMRREGLQVGRAPDDFNPDRGWDYAPGASLLDELRAILERKATALPTPIARSWLTDILHRTAGATWRSLRAFAQKLLDLIQ